MMLAIRLPSDKDPGMVFFAAMGNWHEENRALLTLSGPYRLWSASQTF